MSRLIDADALMERLAKKKPEAGKARYTDGYNDALLTFRSMVHGAPTVEAVPVVRCKECVHRHPYGPKCTIHQLVFEDDHFCSDGIRKPEKTE